MMINGSDIVFEENVFVMNLIYNVRFISVEKVEFILFIVKVEYFEFIFLGVKVRVEYDFFVILL